MIQTVLKSILKDLDNIWKILTKKKLGEKVIFFTYLTFCEFFYTKFIPLSDKVLQHKSN